MRRFIYVVLDGVGVGALPDAADYGDEGSDTLGNTSLVAGLRLPFLQSLGLGNISPLLGVAPVEHPRAIVGRLAPHSMGKDTTVGHWEQMGLITSTPFPTYAEGFPPEVIAQFGHKIGRGVLGNYAASGTEIIDSLGEQHLSTGSPIVYTSADSVFQIAAHVDVVPLATLYAWCEIARDLLSGEHGVARVIARPFRGAAGAFVRTPDRRDYSLPPPGDTYLDLLQTRGVPVLTVGKVSEIFAGWGVDRNIKVGSNAENLAVLAGLVQSGGRPDRAEGGLMFTNLVDFDTAWGHRNDVEGFARGLEEADEGLARIAALLGPEDRLLVTADHGVDPTTVGTDHSREYVPVLVYTPVAGVSRRGVYEGEFADAGATAFEHLTGEPAVLAGRSIDAMLPTRGWRRATPVQGTRTGSVAGMPGRVGEEEARVAGRWLADNLGEPPTIAVVLGSGLSAPSLRAADAGVAYGAIPGWREGHVPGHPYVLTTSQAGGVSWAVMHGRIHEYEGFDLSEVQLPVRSLAAWGVRKVVLTSAGGAVQEGLRPGTIVVCSEVLDLQYRTPEGRPVLLRATPASSPARPSGDALSLDHFELGIHASVPGPQYETAAELSYLRDAGVATVSMTPAGELRAALDEGMNVAVLTVVTNAGETTHSDVLAAADAAGHSLGSALEALGREWS